MQEQKDKISFDDRIINWVSSNLFYSFLILVLIILIILLFVFGITALIYKDPTILNPNEIGDAIGGMTAPIIGLFSAFLVYIAFREQKRANDEIIKQNNNVIFDKYINIIDKLVEKFQKVEIEESTFRTTDPMLKGKKALEYIFFDEYINFNKYHYLRQKHFEIIINIYQIVEQLINQIEGSSLENFEKYYLFQHLNEFKINVNNKGTILTEDNKEDLLKLKNDIDLNIINRLNRINKSINDLSNQCLSSRNKSNQNK